MQFYTYLHCKPDGTPFYVGKGSGNRSHKLSRCAGRSIHHQNIVAKYGMLNIGVFVFPCASEDQAFSDEIQQIAQLRREGYALVNLTHGGDGSSGCIKSKETRLKISLSGLGRKHSDEAKRKISEAGTGRVFTDDTKNKISLAHKGRKHSTESRSNMAAAHAGHQSPMIGKKHSKEALKKMSDAHIGRSVATLESRKKMSIARSGKPWTESRRIAQEKRREKCESS